MLTIFSHNLQFLFFIFFIFKENVTELILLQIKMPKSYFLFLFSRFLGIKTEMITKNKPRYKACLVAKGFT